MLARMHVYVQLVRWVQRVTLHTQLCLLVCVCACAAHAQGEEDNWLDTGLPKATALAIHEMTQDEMNMMRISFEEIDAFGLKFKDEVVYDVRGCMVNLADLTDAPEDASRGMVYALTTINVFVSGCGI